MCRITPTSNCSHTLAATARLLSAPAVSSLMLSSHCVCMPCRLPGMRQQGVSGCHCSVAGSQATLLSQAVVGDTGVDCDVGEWHCVQRHCTGTPVVTSAQLLVLHRQANWVDDFTCCHQLTLTPRHGGYAAGPYGFMVKSTCTHLTAAAA
jgi:hypothetical protein